METTQTTITKIKEVTLLNLFDYATSELSQDAFISWLLMWGNEKYRNVDAALHSIACKLINEMICEQEDVEEQIEVREVKIKQQEAHIDVLAIVKDTNDIQYAIIIEDKTDTSEHSNQLRNYTTYVSDKYKNHIIKCVYYKSGNECKSKIQKMTNNYNTGSNKLKIITRADFLEILCAEVCNNLILQNYIAYLQEIERLTNLYKEREVAQWGSRAWEGFCMDMENKLDYKSKWQHSPYKKEDKNGKYDVIEFTLTIPIKESEAKLYLQIYCCRKKIEYTHLFFRIKGSASISTIPETWRTAIKKFNEDNKENNLKASTIHKGKQITNAIQFAHISGEDFFGKGIVKVDKIADRLVQWHEKLQALAKELSATEVTQSNK